jgi:hypothetical protein
MENLEFMEIEEEIPLVIWSRVFVVVFKTLFMRFIVFLIEEYYNSIVNVLKTKKRPLRCLLFIVFFVLSDVFLLGITQNPLIIVNMRIK